MIDIFSYTNFRLFLKDYYTLKKNSSKGFSFRKWSELTSVKSPSFYKDLIEGSKKLSITRVNSVCEACELDHHQSSYFKTLVKLDNSTNKNEKLVLKEFLKNSKEQYTFIDDADDIDLYLSKWYLPALREVADHKKINSIKSEILAWHTPLNLIEIKEGLKILTDLGYLVLKDGIYKQSSPILKTDFKRNPSQIKRWQKKVLLMGFDAIDQEGSNPKKFNNTTLKLGPQQITKANEIIDQAKKELLALAEQQQNLQGEVYLWNSQFFPLK
jgi:uncharacterized protein (TIGR02147 family)